MVRAALIFVLLAAPWFAGCGDGVLGFSDFDEGGGSVGRFLTLVKVHSGTYSSSTTAFDFSGDVLDGDGLASGLAAAPDSVAGAAGGTGAVVTTATTGLRARMDLVFDASNIDSNDIGELRNMQFSAAVKGGARTASCSGGAVDPDSDGFEVRFWWPGTTPQRWSNSSASGSASVSGIQVLLQNTPGSDVEPNQALYNVPPYVGAIIVSVRSTGDAPSGGCSVLTVMSAQLELYPDNVGGDTASN